MILYSCPALQTRLNYSHFNMASLSEVIRTVASIVDNATELKADLEWPTSRLRSCLELCSRTELSKWDIKVKESGSKKSHDRKFHEVQPRINKCLKSASKKAHALRLWIERRKFPDSSVLSYRHLVILALKNVLQALECFCVLRGNPEGIVLQYLKKCYGFMISLGQLLYPYKDDDNWFTECKEYLDKGLPEFAKLDGRTFRRIAENPTLPGQIMDETEIPATFLPSWPEPALAVRTRGPYGPALSKNLYCSPQEAGVGIPFLQEAINYQRFDSPGQYSVSSYDSAKSTYLTPTNTYSPLPQYTSYYQETSPPSSNESSFRHC